MGFSSTTAPRFSAGWRRCRGLVGLGGGGGATRSAYTIFRFMRFRRMNSRSKDTLMFTGIIEELGTVITAGARLRVACRTVLSDATLGASIAVNGVCLTAAALHDDWFSADLAPETLKRSNLGDLRAGSRVNLERPLAANGRLNGHIVQGTD